MFYDVGFTYIYCAYKQMSWLFGKKTKKREDNSNFNQSFSLEKCHVVLHNYWLVKNVILVVSSN